MFDFDPKNFRIEDLDRIARESEEALQSLTDVIAEIGEVTGVGEGADGLIQVTLDSSGRAVEVEVNPRLMRLSSEDIAEGMLDAFNAAQDDLQAATQRMVSEALPEGLKQEDASQEAMRSKFDQLLDSFNQAMSERQAALDQIRRP